MFWFSSGKVSPRTEPRLRSRPFLSPDPPCLGGAGRGDGHVAAAPQRRVSAARPSGQGLASAAASPHATAKARMNFIRVVLVAFPGFPAIRLT